MIDTCLSSPSDLIYDVFQTDDMDLPSRTCLQRIVSRPSIRSSHELCAIWFGLARMIAGEQFAVRWRRSQIVRIGTVEMA